MKQRISYDLIRRRYSEMRKGGMSKKQATYRMGRMLLKYYNIETYPTKRWKPLVISEPVEVIEYMEKHCNPVLLDDPKPITDLPNAVDFKFLRNEKKNRVI